MQGHHIHHLALHPSTQRQLPRRCWPRAAAAAVQYQGEGSPLPQGPQPSPPALQTPSATGLQLDPNICNKPPSFSCFTHHCAEIEIPSLHFPTFCVFGKHLTPSYT